MSLEALRNKSASLVDNLKEQAQKAAEEKAKSKREEDPRFWSVTMKGGKGTWSGGAKIRFLPAHKNEAQPWNTWWSYSFKHEPTGLYYIEKSLASLKIKGLYDPMAEYNNKLWKTGEAGQAQAKKQKRNLHYVANIMVINDPANPENNGKVFLFKYGAQIQKKIDALMFPPAESGEESINVFDPWNGLDFTIVVTAQGEYPNYESSSFARTPTKLAKTDEEIMKIWESQYELSEFTDPKNYKTREQLQERINKVFGLVSGGESKAPNK